MALKLHLTRLRQALHSYCAQLQGQANVCKYIIHCPSYQHPVDYTNHSLGCIRQRNLGYWHPVRTVGQTNQKMLEEVVHYFEVSEADQQNENSPFKSLHKKTQTNNHE